VAHPVLRLATAAGLGGVILILRWATTPQLAAARDDARSFDELVGLAAALACWTLLGWVALVLTVTALAALRGWVGRVGRAVSAWVTPAAMCRVAQLALGLAVVAGPVPVASAASATPGATRLVATSEALFLPDVARPGWTESANTATSTREDAVRVHPEGRTTVVMPGDCLWTIAATYLGPGASNAEIAAEWPRWYAANRQGIGADPNLLLPGMVLRAPAAR
jgi:resuscitation-promoting factor RpfA